MSAGLNFIRVSVEDNVHIGEYKLTYVRADKIYAVRGFDGDAQLLVDGVWLNTVERKKDVLDKICHATGKAVSKIY